MASTKARPIVRPQLPEIDIVTSIGSPYIYVRQRTGSQQLGRINRATMRCSCWYFGDGPCLHVRAYLAHVAREKGSSS